MRLALFLAFACALHAAPADDLRATLREARGLIDAGAADRAIPLLASVLAAAADLPREEAAAALLTARAQARTGDRNAALKHLARAMRRARDSADGHLALSIAREAALTARRLGANDHAMAYERLAQEELSKGKFALKGAEAFAVGELPRPVKLTLEEPRYRPPPTPLGMHSYRATLAAFRKRVKEDPSYLADLTRLKGFRDDPATTLVETLQEPGVYVEPLRRFKDDYKIVSQALGYYKFALRLNDTLEDEFALATLYVNMTFLRTDGHPATEWIYGLTKTAAVVEATKRIISMSVTGNAMNLTILALDKLLIDVIRHYSRGARDQTTADLIGLDDDD